MDDDSRTTNKSSEGTGAADQAEAVAQMVPETKRMELLEACSAVESVFPVCRQRHEVLLEEVRRSNSLDQHNMLLSYISSHYSVHQSIYQHYKCMGTQSALEADKRTSDKKTYYVGRIQGLSSDACNVILRPKTFISCLQHILAGFDSIFEDVFSDKPGQCHVKVPPKKFIDLKKIVPGASRLPDDFGFMVEFWCVFHGLQCIVDTIATHVPNSRAALQEIASLDMVNILEMYCSCYDGDLLLLKSDCSEVGGHPFLKECTAASSDLFCASEFLPFFDDAYTILAQFFLIVDMCVGKGASNSDVSRSSDEWKSVVLEAKRMFNPFFYKCDLNAFCRRVVKPGPPQCSRIHQSIPICECQSGTLWDSDSVRYIFSEVLLEDLERLYKLLEYTHQYASRCVDAGNWYRQHIKEQSVVRDLLKTYSVMLCFVWRHVSIVRIDYHELCALYSFLREWKSDDAINVSNAEMASANMFHIINPLGTSIDFVVKSIEQCKATLKPIIEHVREDKDTLNRIVTENERITPGYLLAVKDTLGEVLTSITSQAAPFTWQSCTASEVSPQIRENAMSSFVSSCSSADAGSTVRNMEKPHRKIRGRWSLVDTDTLDKGAEAAATTVTSFRDRLKNFLTSEP